MTRTPTRKKRRGTQALHYFRIHANPLPGSRNVRHGGAYISCWVNFPHGEGAQLLARHYIRGWGWRVRSVQEHRYPTRADYVGDPALKYFDEAAADGCSFVFHAYPPDKPRKTRPRRPK